MLEIKKNNQTIELRNLQEQVQKNKEEIAKHWDVDRILADFGIKIQGQRASFDEIRDINPGENYGYAYLIGTEEPYSVFIWSRPDPNAGKPDAYWLDIGHITAEGPEGPQGIQGPEGPTGKSTRWYVNNVLITTTDSFNPGDMLLLKNNTNTNGNVYILHESPRTGKTWIYQTNILGPQGIQGKTGPQGSQGPQGEKGDKGDRGEAGGLVKIAGILNNVEQLPTPASLNDTTIGYLVGAAEPYDLYIQVGINPATAIWNNVGAINAATLVFVNGIAQTTWDADTKLDKNTAFDGKQTVYTKYPSGAQGSKEFTSNSTPGTIAERTATGELWVALEPSNDSSATSKKYVDKKFAPASPTETINWTDRNPHAFALDDTLTGTIETGAKLIYSTVLNKQTTAYNAASLAIGNKSIAKGDESLAGGYQSVTLNSSAVAIGEQALAAGKSSVAFGNNTQALKDHSMAIGYDTKADAVCAFAGGNGSKALAENSFATGSNCEAHGPHSVAMGSDSFTSLIAYAGLAAGLGIKSTSDYQAAVGRYNESLSGNMFEVGNGESNESRKNIFSVTRDGRAKADTVPTDNNDLTNKLYVDNQINTINTDIGKWESVDYTIPANTYVIGNDTAVIDATGFFVKVNKKQRLISFSGRIKLTTTANWTTTPGIYLKTAPLVEKAGSLAGSSIAVPIVVTRDGEFQQEMGYISIQGEKVTCLQYETLANHREAGVRVFYANVTIPY